jgi:hypothetical protein
MRTSRRQAPRLAYKRSSNKAALEGSEAMNKARAGQTWNGTERRSGKDRRHVDTGPHGRHERRRHLEPRRPEVAELQLSDSEWAALTQGAEAAAK